MFFLGLRVTLYSMLLQYFCYLRCLKPFISRHSFKLHFLSFRQRLKPVHLNCGIMYKNILPRFIVQDEAVALFSVKPFYAPLCHSVPPLHLKFFKLYHKKSPFVNTLTKKIFLV